MNAIVITPRWRLQVPFNARPKVDGPMVFRPIGSVRVGPSILADKLAEQGVAARVDQHLNLHFGGGVDETEIACRNAVDVDFATFHLGRSDSDDLQDTPPVVAPIATVAEGRGASSPPAGGRGA